VIASHDRHVRDTVLITGASGLVGAELARRLGRRYDVIALWHRARPAGRSMRGDLTKRNLGLSSSDARALRERVTTIVHAAGGTEFSMTRDAAERVNAGATANLLAFARGCARVQKIILLSTIYVAGKRRGVIREEELAHRAGFVNEYERSKYRAEVLARRAMRDLPLSVVRLSTIIGSSRGTIAHYNAVHHALRLLHNGLVPMVPGEGESRIDLIALDDATRAIESLLLHFEPGTTLHVAAGRTAPRLDDFLRDTMALFARHGNGWRARGVETPPIVPLRTFRLLEATARTTGDIFLQHVMATMSAFAPQLSYPKIFDTASLERRGIRPRPLVEYYDRVIRFALRRGWR
jgi:nucleoside-diphosphate-sugar epimerase